MKKIYFVAISMMMILLSTSCSNDEIKIDKVGRKFDLTLNVSTQGIYDQFDITNQVRDKYLRDGSQAVGVHTFLYNQNGELVEDKLTTLTSYSTANQMYSGLIEGSYTIVAVETLVNPNTDNKSSSWTIEGTESLSTLKAKTNGSLAWAAILGISTTTVNLIKNTELSMEPQAIGARINFYCFNIENAVYPNENGTLEIVTHLGLATSDILDSYSLNPHLSHNDRYTENTTSHGKTNVRLSNSTENFVNSSYFCYVVEKEATWRYSFQLESDDSNMWTNFTSTQITSSIEDGKTYEAGFYYFDSNHLPSTFFGDYNSLVSWKQECDDYLKSLTPTSTGLYKTPFINWSTGTVSAVKSYMDGVTMVEDITLQSDGKYRLSYYDSKNNGTIYWYDFQTSTSGLTDSYVIVQKEYVTLNQVKEELESEGYVLTTQGDDYYVYVNSSVSTAIYLYELTSYFVIDYFDPSAYSSSSAPKKQHSLNIPSLHFERNQNFLAPLNRNSGNVINANCCLVDKELIK